MNTLPSTELIDRLAAEFVERYRRGERPAVSEYAARCPERAAEICDLFPALVVLENFKPAPPAAGSDQAHCATEVSVLGKLGDYRIIREIGRGGMGIVYEAVQESLGRRVALKVLPKQLVGDSSRQARFEREARSAARLHHSNIVPVYGVGEECGLHYYAMQYIHGQGLDEVLRELKRLRGPSQPAPETKEDSETPASDEKRKEEVGFAVTQALLTGNFATPTSGPLTIPCAVPPADVDPPTSEIRKTSDTTKGRLSDTVRLSDSFAFPGLQPTKPGTGRESYWQGVSRIGIQVGEALNYAHEQGVLHRDVKPSNLLLDSTGSVWVTDFGLAKTEDERALTHTGDVVGTLRYMAPEMFSGHADRRSDGYSLGLTLYELLALRPAFNERDRGRLIRMVLNESPPKLRTLDPHIPLDLETIVHKAIDREPSHRYLTGRDLADDLQRYLRDEPIHARRISIATRFSRWCKRNPAVASLTTAIAILLLAAAISSSIAAAYLNRARTTALRERNEANIARTKANDAARQEFKLRREAEEQRDRANDRDRRARRAVDFYLSKVTDEELLSVPGLQPLREELLAEALKFYSEFTKEQTDDPQLQIELASAQFRLGIVHRELGNATANAAFQAANKEAIRMLESLRDRKLGGVDALSLLAEAYFYAGRYDDTVRLCQEILKASPDAVSARSTLAETYNELAIKQKNEKNDVAATLKYHQQAFEIREKLANEFPENAAYNAELASTINNIGVLLGNQNKPQEELAMFQLAVTYNEKACRLAPHSILWGRWLATGYGNIGNTQLRLGQPQETLQAYHKKAGVWQRLVAQNPAVGYLRSDYYQALVQLAEQQKQAGQPDEANRTTRDAKEVLASMLRRNTPADLFELATVYASLAAPPDPNLEARADTPEDADERLRNADRAMDTLQQAVDAGWADPAALKNYKVLDVLRERPQFQKLAKVVESVSAAVTLLNSKATSDQGKLADQQKALELLNKMGAEVPEQVGHQRLLAATYHSIGVIQTGLKQYDEAEKSFQQALQVRDAVRKAQPGKPELDIYWISTRVALGNLYCSSARFPEAHRVWQECSRELLEIARANRDDAVLQQRIAAEERLMCDGYGRYGLWPLAGQYVQRAVEFQRVSSYEQDAEFAALVLLPENANVADQYLAMLAKTSPGTEERESWAVTHLVRTAALARSNAVPASELVSRARKALAFRKDNPWWAMVLAKALYRTGEIEEAHDLIHGLGELGSHAFANPQFPYVRAVIASARGDDADARANIELGESLYRRACRQTFAHPAVNSLGLPNENWHEFILVQAQRREAMRLLQSDEPGDDPWQHLVQARGYRLIGEKEQADAELAAAKALAPSDSDVLIAAIGLEAHWDAARVTEADWQRAIGLAGENSLLPLIQRGRWHAERGEHEKADADFAKAASLTPSELNKFLETGWWVAGPYPPELNEFCPPELDPDPSQPVYVIDPAKGLSDQPVAWRYAPTGELGLVDLLAVFEAEQMSAYALTYIYSPDARPATLLVGGDDRVRLWVNGRLEYDYDKSRTWTFGLARVPVILRAGRNVILAKVRQFTGGHRLYVRVADTPLDRAFTAAEEWRWEEAARLATEGVPRAAPQDSYALRMQALLLYVTGDMEGHRRLCDELRRRWGHSSNPHDLITLVYACGLSPETVEDPKQLLGWAEQAQLPAETEKWRKHFLAMAYYRAGQFDETIDCIHRDIGPSDQLIWPLLAMAHFRLGKVDEARTWLRKIEDKLQTDFGEVQAAGKVDSNRASAWTYIAEQLIRLREAKQLIDGQAPQVDQLVQALKDRLREPLGPNDALTAEFDHAVLLEPSLPWHRLARGRFLADLGRWDDAEADFDAAVKLNAQDHVAAAARAAFLADRDDVPRAADAFSSALQAANAKDWTNLGRMVEYELSQHGAVLQELLRRDPLNPSLNRIRGEVLARQGRWDEARQSYSAGNPHWLQQSCNATLSRLLQDDDGFAKACALQPDLLRKLARDPELWGARQVEIRGLKSVAPAEAEELVRLMKQNSSTAPLSRHQRVALGLALYRNGQFEDAIEALTQAVTPRDDWQRDARVWPVLAMACWQLDRDDEARQWLARSDAWIDLTHRAVDIPLSVGPNNTVMDWWLYAHVLHLEAKALIDGQAAADDVRQRIAASAKIRADEKFVKASPRNADAAALADAAWQSALERGAGNPQLWIARGRWNVQRGQAQQAAADFARAATMTKALTPFLDAGWWVAGPVCADADYEKLHPVETNPDPVTTVLHADGTTRLTWRHAPTGALGYVDVNPLGTPGVKCAVTYLYSERAREAPLLLGGHGTAKVWVNGTYVGRVDGMNGDAFWPPLNRLAVPLRPGRNSLLIKICVANNRSDFYARFSEGDIDRGVDYAQRGLIAEAGDLLDRGLASSTADSTFPWWFAVSSARVGMDDERYGKYCAAIHQRFGDSTNDNWVAINVRAQTLLATPIFESSKLVERAEYRLSFDPQSRDSLFLLGLALYRAGRDAEARQRLLESGPSQDVPTPWPVLALIAHRQKDNAEARRWLMRAMRWYDQNVEGLATGMQPVMGNGQWSEFLALLREATSVIEGRPLADDPRLHLWRARSWISFDEAEQAQADLAAAAALAPRDHRVWLAIGQIQAGSDALAPSALASLDKAVELAASDPLPWIARGRWHAQHGAQTKADADYAKAASLTPSELHRFLEAGWWVVGPYPRELNEFCPPELDADPSIPVHIVDPQTGLSDEPVPWANIPSGDFGRLELASYSGARGNVSCYAMAHVYSPRETTATICIAGKSDARVWINGELVQLQLTPFAAAGTWSRDPQRAACVLREGRNTILVKGIANSELTLRLGDHPYDRGMELARYGEWKEAADLVEQGLQRSSEVENHSYPIRCLATFRLADGDLDAVRRMYRELSLQHQGTTWSNWREDLVKIGGWVPGIADDPGALVTLAESLRGDSSKYSRAAIPLAYVRAGRWQEAIDFCARDGDVAALTEIAPLLAMAHQQLGNSSEAQAQLARTKITDKEMSGWARRNPEFNVKMSLLMREAGRMLSGSQAQVEQQFDAFYRQRRAARARFSRETFDFDTAALVFSGQSPFFVARGKRLAELGRLSEAEAEFNQAVSQSPKNTDVLTQRALFHADYGDPQKAAADFDAALQLIEASKSPRWQSGHTIDLAATCRDSVYAPLAALRTKDGVLLHMRALSLLRRGQPEPLAAACQQLEKLGWQEPLAPIHLVRGDLQEFERLRAGESGSGYDRTLRLGLAPTDEATTVRLLKAAEDLTREAPQDRFRNRWIGLAQLRAGRLAEAKTTLLGCLDSQGGWQFNSVVWPMLAIACHQLGEDEEASRWLHKSEIWLHGLARLAPAEIPGAIEGRFYTLHDWLIACLLYREAMAQIDGPEAAAAELAAVASPQHTDAPRMTPDQRVEQHLSRLVAAAGNDPLPWIQRGRWLAERGEHERADADFAQAAALTPHELNKFLTFGWWVVGPFGADLAQTCPPEDNPDPSQPLPGIDPRSNSSGKPWQTFPTDDRGRVDLTSMPPGSAYALAFVYSPDARTALLRLEGNPLEPERLRLFVNRKLVTFKTETNIGIFLNAVRVPIDLRPGRNVILVKALSGTKFALRLGDSPVDRATLLAERRLWPDAAKVFADDRQAFQSEAQMGCEFGKLALLSGKSELYREQCANSYERYREDNVYARSYVASLTCLAPNPVLESHYDDVIRLAFGVTSLPVDQFTENRNQMATLTAAWAALQTDRLPEAEQYLARLPSEFVPAHSARAILAEKSGNHAEAVERLKQALANAAPMLKGAVSNPIPKTTTYLLHARGAERIVTGSTTQIDELLRTAYQQGRATWDKADPLTEAYDHLVLTNKASHRPWPPGLAELHRGRRLVELGRFEQAEADFNTAAKLRPADVEVLTARGAFFADRGRLDAAVTDFTAATARAPRGEPATRWFGTGAEQIEDLVAKRDNLFERMIAATPGDRYVWIARAHHFGKDLRYKESLPPLLKAVELDPSDHVGWIHAASVRLALGDEEGYRQMCHEMLTRFAKDNGPRVASRVAKSCLLAPLPAEDQAPLRALVERVEQEGVGSSGVLLRWDYFVKGLAEYRAGRFAEAITLLKLGLPRQAASPLNDGPTYLVLAMAQFRLGEADKARESLAAALDLMERTLPRLDRGERYGTGWPDRARLEVLRREAVALIEGPAAAALQPGSKPAQAAAPAPK